MLLESNQAKGHQSPLGLPPPTCTAFGQNTLAGMQMDSYTATGTTYTHSSHTITMLKPMHGTWLPTNKCEDQDLRCHATYLQVRDDSWLLDCPY